MKLLEQYEELVERSASEMSYAWKGILLVVYFLTLASSYACALLFYIFWYDVCGGHCFFWAEVELQPRTSAQNISLKIITDSNASYDWTQDVLVIYQFHKHCKWFTCACLLSCIVAITLLMMFSICGKGGYDTSLFVAPWRIVLPALTCNLIMMFVSIAAAHNFTQGYFRFSENLYQVAYRVMQTTKNPLKYEKPYEAFQRFITTYNTYNFDITSIYIMIQISSWTITWTWVGGFFILCLRVLTSADFNFVKIKIYEMPKEGPAREAIFQKIQQGRISIETQPRGDSTTADDATVKEKLH